jgi:hypothetical protein
LKCDSTERGFQDQHPGKQSGKRYDFESSKRIFVKKGLVKNYPVEFCPDGNELSYQNKKA